jgi:hypothetical protein
MPPPACSSLLPCSTVRLLMAAPGHLRHFERPLEMSAMPPIATKNGEPLKRRRRARSRRRAAARERQAPVEGPAPPLAWPVVHSAAEPPARASRRPGRPKRTTPASSSATPTGRRSPTSISRRSRAGARRRTSSPATRPGASPPTSPRCRSSCASRETQKLPAAFSGPARGLRRRRAI